jgi:DNA invertase Pin-like site-specific DNA recombinase
VPEGCHLGNGEERFFEESQTFAEHVQTLDDLLSWRVSVLAQTGLSFDLSTASGKLMRTIMAGLAEFERDLIRERVKSGLAAAKARGVALVKT